MQTDVEALFSFYNEKKFTYRKVNKFLEIFLTKGLDVCSSICPAVLIFKSEKKLFDQNSYDQITNCSNYHSDKK